MMKIQTEAAQSQMVSDGPRRVCASCAERFVDVVAMLLRGPLRWRLPLPDTAQMVEYLIARSVDSHATVGKDHRPAGKAEDRHAMRRDNGGPPDKPGLEPRNQGFSNVWSSAAVGSSSRQISGS